MLAHRDKLHQWLGIPPDAELNHYVLLGVPLFTQETPAIRRAYSDRLDYLRKKAYDDAEAANVLQHAVREAAECLIDAGSRARYEQMQRGGEPVAMAAAGNPPGLAVTPPPLPASGSSWLLPVLGLVCLLGLGGLGVVAWWLLHPREEQPIAQTPPEQSPPGQAMPPAEAPQPPAEKPSVSVPGKEVEDPLQPADAGRSPRGAAPIPAPPAETVDDSPFKVVVPAKPIPVAPVPRPRVVVPATPPERVAASPDSASPFVPVEPTTAPVNPPVAEAVDAPPESPLPGTSNVVVGPPGFPTLPAAGPRSPGASSPASIPGTVGVPAASPAALPAREAVSVADFGALPKSLPLPTAIVQGERTLASWTQPLDGAAELELVSKVAQLPEGQSLSLAKVEGREPPQWRVNVAGAGPAPLPLAQFTLADRELRFQWAKDIRNLPYEQLANCLLRLRAGGQTQTIVLRDPLKVETPTLPMAKKIDTLPYNVSALPKLDSLHLLLLADPAHWPAAGKYRKGASFAPLGQPIVMEFEELEGVTIEYRLVRKGEGLAVLISGKVKDTTNDEIELTTERIASLRTGTESALSGAQRDLVLRAQELQADRFRFANAQARPANNLNEVQQKQAALDALQSNIQTASNRIAALQKRIPQLQKRLAELPRLEKIVQKLHDKAPLPFKIVSALESDEIVLVDGS